MGFYSSTLGVIHKVSFMSPTNPMQNPKIIPNLLSLDEAKISIIIPVIK